MVDVGGRPPCWLLELFFDRGESSPELLRDGRAQVWASGGLVAKVYPSGAAEDVTAEQLTSTMAGSVVHVAQPQGISEGPGALVAWWRRVRVTRLAVPPETVAWLRILHDRAPLPPRPAFLALRPPSAHEGNGDFLSALTSLFAQQYRLAHSLSTLPGVLVHGDANPTNFVVDDLGSTVGLDFEFAGVGPRVFDLATVGVILEETGAGTLEQALVVYGEQSDVTLDTLELAAALVRVNRVVACAARLGWLSEGWDRLRAWREGRAYVFPAGAGPK